MFNLYQLQIFQVVAEAGNISRAAEQLFLTQPAVSQHVRTLEKELGVQLFERGSRGVTLTPPGEIFLDYTRCLLRLAEEARDAVTRTGGIPPSRVRIGASPGVGVFLLPEWIHAFHQRHPTLSVTLRTAATPVIVTALTERQIDVGIVEGQTDHDAIEATPLWDEEIALVIGHGHPWWSRQTVDAEELADQGFIVREEGSLTRAWEQHALERHDVALRVIAAFDTPVAIKQAVISGLGIALLPRFAIQHELASGLLQALRLSQGPLVRTLWLLWGPGARSNSTVQAFVGQFYGDFPHLPLHLAGDEQGSSLLSRVKAWSRTGEQDSVTGACSE
jgi:DNA-binding transcriptional LysR family regulator